MTARSNAAVDYDHLRAQAADDAAVMREVLQLFLVHTEQVLKELASATDRETWKQLTHTLKGSARGVGAFGVANAAAEAELSALDKDKVHRLQAEFECVRAFVEKYPV